MSAKTRNGQVEEAKSLAIPKWILPALVLGVGARIALALAARYPEYVRSLVLNVAAARSPDKEDKGAAVSFERLLPEQVQINAGREFTMNRHVRERPGTRGTAILNNPSL